MTMNFDTSPDFKKDLKHLIKKYQSLPEDLEGFKKILRTRPIEEGKHFHRLSQMGNYTVMKARLFCRYLKGASLRIVYAYNEKTSTITFIEVYYKGEQENHDGARVRAFFI